MLCICADDFGLRVGVNAAILALLDAGRIQAVSCMVGCSAWPEGAQALRERDRRRFDAGLHLDLTESPLLEGSKHRLAHLTISCMSGSLPRQVLRREIDAQFDAFEADFGSAPTHVDGHQHVHQLPLVRDELLAALSERYGEARPWIRSTRAARPSAWSSPKAWLIAALGDQALTTLAGRRGFRHNRRLLGVYDFRGGETRYRALLRGWLRLARNGDLLMCHPGIGADGLDGIAAARGSEFSVLAEASLQPLLQAERLRLQPLSRWLAAAPL